MNCKTCLYIKVAKDSPFEVQTFISQYPLVWQTAARLTAQEPDGGENGPFENIQPWARLMEAAGYCRSCSLDKILYSQVSPCYRYKFDLRLNHPRLFGAHIFGIHRAVFAHRSVLGETVPQYPKCFAGSGPHDLSALHARFSRALNVEPTVTQLITSAIFPVLNWTARHTSVRPEKAFRSQLQVLVPSLA